MQVISKSTVLYDWNIGDVDVACIFYLNLRQNLKRKQRLKSNILIITF